MKKFLITTLAAFSIAFGSNPILAAGKLNIYNWFEYLPQDLIDKFSAEYDVEVTMDTYDSNESLLARLKSGVTGYDIAVPSDYMVQIMIEEGLLEQVNAFELDNFKHMDPNYVEVYFDPGRKYSVPYQWGTTAFAVDTAVYSGDIDTLEIIFNPPPELQGKINMLKDVNDVINAGLRYLGLDRCNGNPEDLKKLNDLLTSAKEHWLSFNSDGAKEVLVTGDVAVGQIWSGFAMRARAEKPTLKYAYPKEGFTGWMDNLVALKGASNLDNAKNFMNFMLVPENAAILTNYARYAAGVMGTEPFLDEELKTAHESNLPASAPAPDFVPPCSPDVVKLYDRIWTNLLK